MATLESNSQIKTVQDVFFSKSNISNLNKIILDKNNMMNVHKDVKKQIIDTLIKNMKNIYKSLNANRINQKNMASIFQQFNQMSIEETFKELKNNSAVLIDSAKLKFERDFNSNPNGGNKIMDRPTPSQNAFLYPPGFNSDKKSSDSKFDNLFKPIVEKVDEKYAFNQYQFGKGTDDMTKRMDNLMSTREGEIKRDNRPPTPEFLKPRKTSIKPEEENRTYNVPVQKGGRPDFTKSISPEELSKGFLSAEEIDLYDINNIDKPIEQLEVEEDSRPFNERLKSLTNSREDIKIPQNNDKIDFQSENFKSTDFNEIPNYEPKKIEDIKNNKYQQREDIMPQKEQLIQQQREQLIKQREELLQQQRAQLIQQKEEQLVQQQRAQLVQQQNLKDTLKKVTFTEQNVNIKKVQESLKKLGLSELEELKKENEKLKLQLKQMPHKSDNLKQEIIAEFEKLKLRDMMISKKEAELKLLLNKYNYLYGTTNVQLDISPTESNSKYTFNFNKIENIVGVKLMSYSIPQVRYNIEDDKNNIFKIKIVEEIIIFKVNTGKYTIDNLIKVLNEKTDKIKFDLNYEQKIEIKSENYFDIIPTILSKEILGFSAPCTENKTYTANKSWDLRTEDKIFLFLNNLDETTPFAVLYQNNQGNYQFKFEDPIILDKLELEFKDSKGRPYNFFGLNYSINVQLEINNPVENLVI